MGLAICATATVGFLRLTTTGRAVRAGTDAMPPLGSGVSHSAKPLDEGVQARQGAPVGAGGHERSFIHIAEHEVGQGWRVSVGLEPPEDGTSFPLVRMWLRREQDCTLIDEQRGYYEGLFVYHPHRSDGLWDRVVVYLLSSQTAMVSDTGLMFMCREYVVDISGSVPLVKGRCVTDEESNPPAICAPLDP